MRTKEALAIVGTCAALGGAIGVAADSHERANADSNVVVTEACRDTYADGTEDIGKQVLKCMREGWIPHAGTADSEQDSDGNSLSELRADYPDGLLEGYIEGQKARAGRVELSKPAWLAVIGAGMGLLVAGSVNAGGNGERRRRPDAPPKEDDEPPKAATPPPPPPSDA